MEKKITTTKRRFRKTFRRYKKIDNRIRNVKLEADVPIGVKSGENDLKFLNIRTGQQTASSMGFAIRDLIRSTYQYSSIYNLYSAIRLRGVAITVLYSPVYKANVIAVPSGVIAYFPGEISDGISAASIRAADHQAIFNQYNQKRIYYSFKRYNNLAGYSTSVELSSNEQSPAILGAVAVTSQQPNLQMTSQDSDVVLYNCRVAIYCELSLPIGGPA